MQQKRTIFGHEKLHVYQTALQYNAYVYDIVDTLKGKHRHARDQLLRAAQSIPLNIAEGNGKSSRKERKYYFEIARGSALECAAIQDLLLIGKAIDFDDNISSKELLDRIVAMLTKLIQNQ